MKNYDSNNREEFIAAWENEYEEVCEEEIEKSWRELKNKVALKEGKEQKRKVKTSFALAATLLMLFGSYFFIEVYNPKIHIANMSPEDEEIILPDGSIILLKQNSKLSYREKFEKVRGVELTGEAFFKVAKDTSRVFMVKSGSVTTYVLGTSFLVSQGANLRDAKISLYTGKVSVAVDGEAGSWKICPGENFIYENGQSYIKEFNTSLSFETGDEYIDINHLSIKKLMEFLEDRFNCEFEKDVYTNEEIVTLRINKSDSLEDILSLLSIINNKNYELNEVTRKINTIKK